MTPLTQELNQPSGPQRPFPRLWNRKHALAIIGLFLLLYVIGQAVVVAVLVLEAPIIAVTAVTVVTSAAAGIGSVLIVNRWRTRHSWRSLGFAAVTRRWLVISTVLTLLVGVARGFGLDWLAVTYPALNAGLDSLNELLVFEEPLAMAISILLISTIIPLWEELFFRGFLHNVLRNRLGMWATIVVSSLLFGLFHLIPLQILGAFTLGLLLAWLYEKTGSLWVVIYAHALNNLVFGLLAFFIQ